MARRWILTVLELFAFHTLLSTCALAAVSEGQFSCLDPSASWRWQRQTQSPHLCCNFRWQFVAPRLPGNNRCPNHLWPDPISINDDDKNFCGFLTNIPAALADQYLVSLDCCPSCCRDSGPGCCGHREIARPEIEWNDQWIIKYWIGSETGCSRTHFDEANARCCSFDVE